MIATPIPRRCNAGSPANPAHTWSAPVAAVVTAIIRCTLRVTREVIDRAVLPHRFELLASDLEHRSGGEALADAGAVARRDRVDVGGAAADDHVQRGGAALQAGGQILGDAGATALGRRRSGDEQRQRDRGDERRENRVRWGGER